MFYISFKFKSKLKNLKEFMKAKISKGLLFGVLAISLMAVGCTRMPTPEELTLLEQQKQAADDAESRVAELENEKAGFERQLEASKKSLADHEAEFEEIKRRKAQ
jgi:hypothetical protein